MARVKRCIEDIREWVLNDKLKLKDDKTEFIIHFLTGLEPVSKEPSKDSDEQNHYSAHDFNSLCIRVIREALHKVNTKMK